MPRPKKWRKISFVPEHTLFKPSGVPKSQLESVTLKLEEVEAMRLKDIENLNQAECAELMSVSRQTFQNIIESARRKVAIALTSGKGIHITGGKYTYNICTYTCQACGEGFSMNFEGEVICPACGAKNAECENRQSFCREHCKKDSTF